VTVQTNKELLGIVDKFNNDPAVTRCDTCGLVQYRTRAGNCRRRVRVLPQDPRLLIPHIHEVVINSAPVKCVNREAVENICQRIRQLRESWAVTQSQLQCYSRVSRSYLSRIEPVSPESYRLVLFFSTASAAGAVRFVATAK
jgi:hypothetical protein